jgi:hypothetical protein
LVYGADAVLPPEIYLESARVAHFNAEDQAEARELNSNLLEEKHNMVLANVQKYQEPIKSYYNNSVFQRDRDIGDCHTLVLRTEPKPPYVCPECSNHMYGQQYGEHIQYLIKLQARIFTKMTRGSKRKIIERCRNLSVDEASTGITGGEAGLVFIFWLLLVPLI